MGCFENVAVALGNWGSPEAVPVLTSALSDDEPLVRGHAAWALGRIATDEAVEALNGRMEVEGEDWVRQELKMGLEEALASSLKTTSFGTPDADSR